MFYTGVGTAFPLYRQKFGKNTEGVMGIGGWSGDSPAIKDYLARHKAAAANGAEPDRWASAVTYASLQMLQQAIERVGKIDRAAVIKDLQTGSFDTVIGKVKLENNMPTRYWWVGQWQDGEFYGIAPGRQRRRAHRDRSEAGVGGAVTSRQRGRSVMTNAILNGLMLGGMYALIAMGLTLQYGVARIMNLSYGEFLIAAAFASHWLFTGWAISPFAGLALVVPLAFVLNFAIYKILLTPLVRRAPNRDALEVDSILRDLRPHLRHSGLDARAVRRGLLQLLVPRLSGAVCRRDRRGQPPRRARHHHRAWGWRSIWR